MAVVFYDFSIAGNSFDNDNHRGGAKLSGECDDDLAKAVSLLQESASEFRANADRLTELFGVAVNALNEFSNLSRRHVHDANYLQQRKVLLRACLELNSFLGLANVTLGSRHDLFGG